MSSQTLSGRDTVIIGQSEFTLGAGIEVGGGLSVNVQYSFNGDARQIRNLADGDCGKITFAGSHINTTVGKDGSLMHAFDEKGRQAEIELRVVRGTESEAYLLDLLTQLLNYREYFRTIQGKIIKSVGTGGGSAQKIEYTFSGGVISKTPEGIINANGDTNQLVATFTISCVCDIAVV